MVCCADCRVEIWIIQTLISAVAQLPTALADRSFCDEDIHGALVISLPGYMLVNYASTCLFRSFTTAPPNFTGVGGLVSATRPVKIFFINEFLITIQALFFL